LKIYDTNGLEVEQDEVILAGGTHQHDNRYYTETEVDAIKLDDLASPDDNTDLNATTSAHGLLPKLDNVVTNFLNGQGGFSAPAGGYSYTELFSSQHVATLAASGWQDWSLTAIIPEGTIAVEVLMEMIDPYTATEAGVRKNGSSLDRKWQIIYGTTAGDTGASVVQCEVASDRIIEVYDYLGNGDVGYRIIGYWS